MENNINVEIINSLAVKIANLEVQLAVLTAENKALQTQEIIPQKEEEKLNEQSH